MRPQKAEAIEGGILGITGFILFFDFMAIDSTIFNFSAPPIIQKISQIFTISPIFVDILTTIGLITIILMLGTERKIGGLRK